MKINLRTFSISLYFAFQSLLLAEVHPNSLFSSGAVLQRDTDIPVWGRAKDGEKVTVQFDGQHAEAVTKDGKWMVTLKPHKAGGPFTLTIAGENTVTIENVLVGEVWVCSGQSNMQFRFSKCADAATEGPAANYPQLRMFNVANKSSLQPLDDVSGKWTECSPQSVGGFSAVGYYFGRDIHKALGVPVGMINSALGGTPAEAWTSLTGLEKDQELHSYVEAVKSRLANYNQTNAKYSEELKDYNEKSKEWNEKFGNAYNEAVKTWTQENEKNKAEGKPSLPKPTPASPRPALPTAPDGGPRSPTNLFNGMIAPLIPYAIKGVIWYQGEANSGKALEYRTLFPRLITDWREKWGRGEFPFLFAQIAPFQGQRPEIREAQLLTWQKVPNTSMVVTTDVGNPTDIHPTQKGPVGDRLALAARALAYGEKLEYSGPVFDTLKMDQHRAIVTFKHTGGGLMANGGDLKGFTIAGADKKFVPAKAEIQGDHVVITSDEVETPVAVRYGWANAPDVNLFNKEGLPASPFRTDPDSAK